MFYSATGKLFISKKNFQIDAIKNIEFALNIENDYKFADILKKKYTNK